MFDNTKVTLSPLPRQVLIKRTKRTCCLWLWYM